MFPFTESAEISLLSPGGSFRFPPFLLLPSAHSFSPPPQSLLSSKLSQLHEALEQRIWLYLWSVFSQKLDIWLGVYISEENPGDNSVSRKPSSFGMERTWGGRDVTTHINTLCLYHTHTHTHTQIHTPVITFLRGSYLIQSWMHIVIKEYEKKLTGNFSSASRNLKPM